MFKKIIASAALLLALTFSAGASVTTFAEETASGKAEDWKPFNYVLSEGFGTSMKLTDIRTTLEHKDGKVTASGTTTKGGMGVTYMPEVNLNDFAMNVSLNSWQTSSPDRWFGITFTDKAEKTDPYNEVPVYCKHSESWSNDYGAGMLFAVRPWDSGKLRIQFNYIGIYPTYDGDGNISANAGQYADGNLGWGRNWLSEIQLYNTDWTVKTDYSDIEITVKSFESNGETGYAFEINNGYWRRLDTVNWDELDSNALHELGVESASELTDEIKDKFLYGPAYETSIIPYANWGDDYYALSRFEKILKTSGKRLYMSYMYKDAWDIDEGDEAASFTINSVGGKAATDKNGYNPMTAKAVSGKISATLTESSLHAGVYPSMVESLVMTDVAEKQYAQAKENIESLVAGKNYKVFTVTGKTASGASVSIIDSVNVTMDLSEFGNAALYKIVGSDLDKIDGETNVSFKMNSSKIQYVLVYGETQPAKKGCGGTIGMYSLLSLAVLCLGGVAVKTKKI